MDEDDFELDEHDPTIPKGGLGDPPNTGGGVSDQDTGGNRSEQEKAEATIEDKLIRLRNDGFDLGKPSGPVQEVSHGGWVRIYDRGRIYWHPASHIGAHEVHGGILQKYLALGGPGRHPDRGERVLKYPTSDETHSADGRVPVSHFEEGAIYWIGGVGGVAIWGAFYDRWQALDGEKGRLGYPLTDPHKRSSIEVTFFEHGCLCRGSGSGGEMLMFEFANDPLVGRQTVIEPTDTETLEFGSPVITRLPDAIVPGTGVTRPEKLELDDHRPTPRPGSNPNNPNDIPHPNPDLDTDPIPSPEITPDVDADKERRARMTAAVVWKKALVLTEADAVEKPIEIPLTVQYGGATPTLSGGEWSVLFRTDLRISEPDKLVRGMPYDVRLRLPDGGLQRLFARAVRVPAEMDAIPSDIVFTEEAIDVIGPVTLRQKPGEPEMIQLKTDSGNISIGADGQAGQVVLRNEKGEESVRIDGASGDISFRSREDAEMIESLEGKLAKLEQRIADLEG